MKTPEGKTITMTFGSHPMRDLKLRWQITLTFPAGATAATVLPIRVKDGEGAPIEDATFEFAGCRIPIRDGDGGITYAQFVAGKHETALWLHRPGLASVPGGLTFG